MNHLLPFVPISFLLACLTILWLSRRSAELSCEALIKRLHRHQLRGMDKYLGDHPATTRDFWRDSGGRKGAWRRWQNRAVLVQLCQMDNGEDGLSPGELQDVLRAAAQLTYATFLVLAVSTIRFAIPEVCDQLCMRSLRLYASLADATFIHFADNDTPLCARLLCDLL